MIGSPIVFLGIALLIALFARLFPAYHIDSVRNKLFAIRNDLFDYVATESTDITFDSYVYGHMRCRINALIRCAHKMGLVQFFVFRLCGLHKDQHLANRSMRFDNKLAIELSKFNSETKDFIDAIDNKINDTMLEYFIKKSFIITSIYVLLSRAMLKLRSAKSIFMRTKNSVIEYLNDEAYSSTKDFSFAI